MFLSVTLDFYAAEDVTHSVGMPMSNTYKFSLILSLRSTDLN